MEVLTCTNVILLCNRFIQQETDAHLRVNVVTAVMGFFFFFFFIIVPNINQHFNSESECRYFINDSFEN